MKNLYLVIAIYVPGLAGMVYFAILAYLKSKLRRANLFLFLLILGFLAWLLANFLADIATTHIVALFWSKAALVGPIFLPAFFLFFVLQTIRPNRPIAMGWYLLSAICIAGLLVFVPTSQNIESVVIEAYSAAVVPGLLYSFFAIYFVVFVAIGLILFVINRKKMEIIEKRQLSFVLLGAIGAIVVGLTTNLILLQAGTDNLTGIGAVLSSLLLASGIVYSINRYQFLDFKGVLQKSVIYVVLIGVIFTAYAFAFSYIGQILEARLGFNPAVIGAIGAALIAISFPRLQSAFESLTLRIFYRRPYDIQKTAKRFARELASTIELKDVARILSQDIPKFLGIEWGWVLISHKKIRHIGLRPPTISEKEIATLFTYFSRNIEAKTREGLFQKSADKRISGSPDSKLDAAIEIIKPLDATFFVPLVEQNRLYGMYILGPRKSRDALNRRDEQLLIILQEVIGTSLNNAELFEEQQRFNEILQQKVREATSQLRVANVRLQQLDKAKTEFLSIASHQLRSPMTSIKGYMSMLAGGDFGALNQKQNKIVSNVFQSTEGLIQMVNLFLDITRIEEGRFELVPVKTDMGQLTSAIVDQLKPQALSHKLVLKYVPLIGALPVAEVDQEKIRQVVVNLIDNAVKYTPKGSVTVSVQINETPINAPAGLFASISRGKIKDRRVSVFITDTGIGLNQEDIDQLYQKFFRVKKAAQVFTGGSGLGLFVVKKIVDLHGGDLGVWSAGRGKGSTFAFSIAETLSPEVIKEAKKSAIGLKKRPLSGGHA